MEVNLVLARLDSKLSRSKNKSDIDLNLIYDCVCPICGFEIPQEEGMPCYNKSCPRCGMLLTKTKL
jgi:hypothetical protein